MANHTYSKGLLYKKTLNSSGEVTGSVPLLLKTLGSLVIMSDGTDAETAISTAISNMVTPDETTIVTGQDGITISVKKSTSAEIDEILGDVPTEHTWEGYYTKSEVNGLVNAVDAKFNQNDIETALGYTPIASSTKGSANGVASLDANGLVPSAQLPSYVDDAIESATFAALPATGETGKIYVTLNDNKTYRWSGSAYVEISQSLALGETSSTAFAGDKGKTAYEHSQTAHARTDATNAAIVSGKLNINGTATNIGDFKAVSTAASQGLTDTEKANALANIGAVPNSDFVVAKQNILLVDEMNGARNECEYNYVNLPAWTGASISVTPDGVKMSGTVSSAYTGFIYSGVFATQGKIIDLTEDYVCMLYGSWSAPTVNVLIQWKDSNGSTHYDPLAIGTLKTIPSGAMCIDGIYIQKQNTTSATINIDIQILLCKKRYYDAGFTTYQPYSLPNTAITPELIELVDSGAKNVWDFANANIGTVNHCTYTKTNTSITVLSDNSGWSYVSYALPLKAGSYVLSGVLSNVTIPTGSLPTIRVATSSNGDGALQTVDIGGKTNYELKFTAPSDTTYYVLFAANWQNASYVAGYTISNIMICTKAAFGVSSKFVPYRPNYDLVCKRASGYFITSETATFAGLLGSAVAAAGFGTTATSHSGLCSVSTTTDDEYLLFYWYYSYNVFCECIQITAKSISLTNKNNQGTIVVTGGTAPYKVTVTVFN